MNKKMTIYDIAELAGVSPATVSRVLNNSGPVRRATRAAVERVIRECNYHPSVLAQSLSTKQSMTIGFILPDITNPFFANVFLEAEKRALELGYTLMLGNSLNDIEIESRNLRCLLDKRVDGIIFMGGRVNEDPPRPKHVAEMAEVLETIPLVMVNGKMPDVDCWHVYSDETQGIREAVDYLYQLGHRHIEMIGGVPGNLTTDIKIDAVREALAEHGLPTEYATTIPGRWSVEDGTVCMEQLLERKDLPTALIAINDLIAIGVLLKARERGFDIPGKLSLVGIDDIYWAHVFRPHLTTISQNYAQLGPTVVDVVVSLGKGDPVDMEIIVPTQLVIRDSCRAID